MNDACLHHFHFSLSSFQMEHQFYSVEYLLPHGPREVDSNSQLQRWLGSLYANHDNSTSGRAPDHQMSLSVSGSIWEKVTSSWKRSKCKKKYSPSFLWPPQPSCCQFIRKPMLCEDQVQIPETSGTLS